MLIINRLLSMRDNFHIYIVLVLLLFIVLIMWAIPTVTCYDQGKKKEYKW